MPKASPTYNLQTKNPIIAKEWHLAKNKPLTPLHLIQNDKPYIEFVVKYI